MRVKMELAQYVVELRMHRRKAGDLLESTKSVDSLVRPLQLTIRLIVPCSRCQVLKLLDLRNYDVASRNATALRHFAEVTSTENHLMVQIAKHTSRDSRTMRITSFIAVTFLPATLLSVRSTFLASAKLNA